MAENIRLAHLTRLRNEIASLQIVKCRMQHEAFVVPASDGRARRVGLCSAEVRAERLGCSHTMARVKLDRAIEELPPGKAEGLSDELNWLTNQIHLLDHQKGEAETRKATAAQESQDDAGREEEMAIASELVEEMEREHAQYVEKVGQIRDAVLASLDEMIREQAPEAQETAKKSQESGSN